jgi:phage shock protein A
MQASQWSKPHRNNQHQKQLTESSNYETNLVLLATQIRRLNSLLEQVQQEMLGLSNRVSNVKSKIESLKKLLKENKVQEDLHRPHDALHAAIFNLKNKQEEIKSQ